MGISAGKRNEILRIIGSDETQRNFFFREVQDPEWVPWLETAGYMEAQNSPAPVTDGKSTMYPEWEVLPFLARVAERSASDPVAENQLERIAAFFLKATKAHQGNWRTLYWLSKILASLPCSSISIEMIESIRSWLDAAIHTADTDLATAELCGQLLPKLLSENPSPDDIAKAELLFEIVLTTAKNNDSQSDSFWSDTHRFVLDDYWLRDGIEKSLDPIQLHFSERGILKLQDSIELLLLSSAARHPAEWEGDEIKLRLGVREQSRKVFFTAHSKAIDKDLGEQTWELETPRDQIVAKAMDWLEKKLSFQKESTEGVEKAIRILHAHGMGEGCHPALDDSSAGRNDEPNNFLISIFWRILDERLARDDSLSKKMVALLFERPFFIFPKISLFLTGKYPKMLRPLFWNALSGKNGDALLEGLFFGKEIKSVLEGLIPLSDSERQLLEQRIEEGSLLWEEDDTKERRRIFWRQQRYQALSADTCFAKKYEQLKEQTGTEAFLGPAFGPIEGRWGFGDSPIPADQLATEPCERIPKLLQEFRPTHSWDEPTIGGLADALEAAVKESPLHFLNGLDFFIESHPLWITRILRGFRNTSNEAAKKKMWQLLIPFIEKYSAQEKFWRDDFAVCDEDDDFRSTHKSVLEEFCSFVTSTCRDDAGEATDHDLERIRMLLHSWIGRAQWPIKQLYDEPVSQAINATESREIETLLQLLLCIARRKTKTSLSPQARWMDADRSLVQSLLEKDAAEVFTLVGMCLPNLFYLDRSWIIGIIPQLLDRGPWKNFMIGFLHRGRFSDELYRILHLHYLRTFNISLHDEESHKVFIKHTTLAYIRGIENLEGDGLFARIVRRVEPNDLLTIVRFVGELAIREHSDKKHFDFSKIAKASPRVITLWRFLLSLLEKDSSLASISKELCAELTEFTGFIEKLDEEATQLLDRTLANGIPANRQYPFFLEYLVEAIDRTADSESLFRLGSICLRLLESCTPIFKKETILNIVERLFQDESSIPLALRICEKYGRNGSDLLKPLFDKYATLLQQ